MNEEVWVSIKGYECLYEVSTFGRVKSLNYRHTKKEKILRYNINSSGYKYVILCKNGKAKNFSIHRLVAIAFIFNSEKFIQVNHIDGNKLNNDVKNLEWCSCVQNIEHAWKLGLFENSRKMSMERNLKKVYCSELDMVFDSILNVERELGISHVSDCCNGRRKSAGKHPETGQKLTWKYVDKKIEKKNSLTMKNL